MDLLLTIQQHWNIDTATPATLTLHVDGEGGGVGGAAIVPGCADVGPGILASHEVEEDGPAAHHRRAAGEGEVQRPTPFDLWSGD